MKLMVRGAMALGVAALASPAALADSWELGVASERYGGPVAVRDLGRRDWQRRLDPRPGRNLAYVEDELRLSRSVGDWRLSLLARSSATLVSNRDALDLAARQALHQAPTASTQWNPSLRMQGFAGWGAELGLERRLAPQWSWRGSAQGLVLGQWRELSGDGAVAYDAGTGSYRFDLREQELSRGLRFPFETGFAARGLGLLLNAQLAWSGERASASVALRDGGWLHWSAMPRQSRRLDTDTRTMDADGFVSYGPLLQGQNSQDGATRMRPWRVVVTAGARVGRDQRLVGQAEYVPGFGVLPSMAFEHRRGESGWDVGWRFFERAAVASVGWRGFRLSIGADRLSGAARYRRLALSYVLELR